MKRERMVFVLCSLAGCIEPDLVLCSDGLACPVGHRCDEIHQTCVSPDQLIVCQGQEEGSDCTAGQTSGGCFDGVCLPRGCGNRVVESGEMCDDGNQISLDGCRGDCTSTEVCGNGFVDPGEPCDDGGLISRDGCDSRCQLEDATWSVVAIAPATLDNHRAAYDAARGRLVVPTSVGDTWEWDGARWTVFKSQPINPYAVIYDPVRQEVNLFGGGEQTYDPEPRIDVQVYAWRDAQWVQISTGRGPSAYSGSISATYDAARQRLMAIETSFLAPPSVWVLDEMGLWVQLPTYPEVPVDAVMVYDPVSGHVLAETGAEEWVYDGTGWTSSPTSFDTVSVAFDPNRGRLILVDNTQRTTYERIGTEWQPIADAAMPCREGRWSFGPLYYNAAAGALDLFSNDALEICRWNGSWSSFVPALPSRLTGATYDPAARRFVFFNNSHPNDPETPIEIWTLTDDSWHRVDMPGAPVGRRDGTAVYSPGRGATVLYGGAAPYNCAMRFDDPPCEILTDAWTFDGTTWKPIAAPPLGDPVNPIRVATYDPEHGRVLLATASEFWSLGDTDDEWVQLDVELNAIELRGLAWDARNQNVVASMLATDGIAPQLYDLREDGWALIDLTPSVFNQANARIALINNERGGGLVAIDLWHGFSWERIVDRWIPLPVLPVPLVTGWNAYNPVNGDVLFVGDDAASGKFAAILSRSSTGPIESCEAGEDIDGDGLAGCDDPECYWACSSCLPHTTCR